MFNKKYSYLAILVFLLTAAFSSHAEEAISFKTDNGTIRLDDLKGQVVYIDFWASWCKPCRKSFPWMNSLHKRFKDQGLTIIAVNLDTQRSMVEKFLGKYKSDFTIAYDPEAVLAKKFNVKGMPSSYLVSRDGKQVFSHVGFREKDVQELENRIQNELSRKKSG